MRTSESVVVPAAPAIVFPHVARLDAYPSWLGLVHQAVPDGGEADRPAWLVELRARVGPVARSKQLRMQRIDLVDERLAVFERAEQDGREHARWALRAELEPVEEGTQVTMHLAYDGRLWVGGILERVLDEEIRRGRTGLTRLVAP
ncbi:MAG: SRPBCC family protein [Ilumatobacter sp.]|uniref:SRPBCC family protein n=1 Tax=Ilumatobacter sp. TaxID=1967498 RepID=UPI00262BA740|nr:SRPBCC family protein [Ilumatobacter sp.]MDJ0770408.1 SRPBCC family protein [Ilumatobacter sp.]